MKYIFFIMFIYINIIDCSYFSCISEKDITKCSEHTINEFSNFICTKAKRKENIFCSIFPKNEEDIPIFKNLSIGIAKEEHSVLGIDIYHENDFIDYYEVNGEQIPFLNDKILINSFSDSEIHNIELNNVCSYQFEGRISNCFMDDECDSRHISSDICYNADHFDELKELVNCGYAEIKLKKDNGKEISMTSCGYIPGDKLKSELYGFFNSHFIQNFFLKHFIFITYGRDELSKISYEVTIIDKNGKKFKSKGNYETSIWSNGEDINEAIEDKKENESKNESKSDSTNGSKNDLKNDYFKIILLLIILIIFI